MGNFILKHFTIFILVLTLCRPTIVSVVAQVQDSLIKPRSLTCTEKSANGKLTLSCSGYPSIPTQIENLENQPSQYELLDLSNGNSLQTIKTAEIANAEFHNLVTLNLARNKIRTIERGAFRDLERLSKIDLSNNNIDSLDLEMFERNDTQALSHLILNGNPIHQFIGTNFPLLPSLKKIELSNCKITKIPVDSFKNLIKLQELYLNGNQLARLDWDVFKTLNQLTHLYLQNNPWQCDCHIKFLQDFLKSKQVMIFESILICTGPTKFVNKSWKSIPDEELTCRPEITHLTVLNGNDAESPYNNNGAGIVYSEIGRDIHLECKSEAYPTPEVKWFKNGKDLAEIDSRKITENNNARDLDDGDNTQIKYEEQMRSFLNDNNYEKYNYINMNLLRIYKADVNDLGEYKCLVKNDFGQQTKSIILNFTNIPNAQEDFTPAVITGGSKAWLWIIIALSILIFIALVVLLIGCWMRRERNRQKALKQSMMEKFKDSHVDLDDISSPNNRALQTQIKRDEADAPLLSPLNNQIKLMPPRSLQIPDVAQGNDEYDRSLSPQVFSPRPQMTANLRRQFFREGQVVSEPSTHQVMSSRPGSALSMNYYNQNSNTRSNAHLPQHPRYYMGSMERNNYNPIRRPGSSLSLAYPEPNYHVARPVMTRQYSGGPGWPSYATMRLPRERRPPSVSSFTSEPPLDMGSRPGFGYVTLPRNTNVNGVPRADSGVGRSLSPTGSSYSSVSYSTLPRRRIDPVTGVVVDSFGPRTTVDGGSNLSLNRIGEQVNLNALESINQGLLTPTKGKVKSARNRTGSTTTPSSLRGRNDFFSFEPIQEVDGSEDVLPKLVSNNELDIFPKIQEFPKTHESRYKKKRPPPVTEIPPRSRKPIRTFEYSKLGGENAAINKNLVNESSIDEIDPNEIYVDAPKQQKLPPLPSSPPPPKPARSQTSMENIIEAVEGTEV